MTAMCAFAALSVADGDDASDAPAGAASPDVPGMGEDQIEVEVEDAPPPGAIYMKNGVWLDKDDNPIEA